MDYGKPGAIDVAKISVARIIANRDDVLVTTACAVIGNQGSEDWRLPNPVVPPYWGRNPEGRTPL
jgi:hypothetical protein